MGTLFKAHFRGGCYAQGMTSFLNMRNIRIFDYPRFAEPLRDELRKNAEKIAAENGLEIEFIRKNDFRKEKAIKDIVKERGHHPGHVAIISANGHNWLEASLKKHNISFESIDNLIVSIADFSKAQQFSDQLKVVIKGSIFSARKTSNFLKQLQAENTT